MDDGTTTLAVPIFIIFVCRHIRVCYSYVCKLYPQFTVMKNIVDSKISAATSLSMDISIYFAFSDLTLNRFLEIFTDSCRTSILL